MSTLRFDHSYINLPERFYSEVIPSPFPNAKIIAINESLASELCIDYSKKKEFTEIFANLHLPKSAAAIAMAYAGHQFGYFVPKLGDGRALLLGEVISRRSKRYDLHFKGSGPTEFSRGGDGKSPLGPVIREFLLSEAMYHLNIPTTRSLAIATTGEVLERNTAVPGGLLTRVASSHIRVGTFEYFAYNNDIEGLQILLQYTSKRHFPENNSLSEEEFFDNVVERQACLVAKWLSVGFVHGVMNTDNTAVSGETIDYGPCAFLDDYDSKKVFSSIDKKGRYSFKNQINIAQWNCARLGDCLGMLLSSKGQNPEKILYPILEKYNYYFEKHWLELMCKKMGLHKKNQHNLMLINLFLNDLEKNKLDYTESFKLLGHCIDQPWDKYFPQSMTSFFNQWLLEVKTSNEDIMASVNLMNASNPIYIPRNHIIENLILNAYNNEFSGFHKFLKLLQNPFKRLHDSDLFERPPRPQEKVEMTFCGT